MDKRAKRTLVAISILIGTTVGAGILGLPYVFSKSGFLFGLIHLIFLGFILLVIKLYLGETILRTKGTHQLVGYAEKYLGKKGRIAMIFAMIFGIYAACIAYFLGIGESLSFLLFSSTQYSILMSFLIWVILATIVALGFKALEKGELFVTGIIIFLVLAIFIAFIPKMNFSNLTYLNPKLMFVPYGVVIFAMLGFSALPQMKKELEKNKKQLKKAIIWGSLIPVFIYIVFIVAVLGFSGANTPEISTIGLGPLPTVFGIFTMFAACLALSFALKEMYMYDLKINEKYSWLLTMFVPFLILLMLKLMNILTFIEILGVGGALTGALTVKLILLMNYKAKKKGERKPEFSLPHKTWITALLFILFFLGAVYEIIKIIFPSLI